MCIRRSRGVVHGSGRLLQRTPGTALALSLRFASLLLLLLLLITVGVHRCCGRVSSRVFRQLPLAGLCAVLAACPPMYFFSSRWLARVLLWRPALPCSFVGSRWLACEPASNTTTSGRRFPIPECTCTAVRMVHAREIAAALDGKDATRNRSCRCDRPSSGLEFAPQAHARTAPPHPTPPGHASGIRGPNLARSDNENSRNE